MSLTSPTSNGVVHRQLSDMKSLLLSPPTAPVLGLQAATDDLFSSWPLKDSCSDQDEEKHEEGNQGPVEDRADNLIQQVSSWIFELTVIREKIERKQIDNALLIDSLYMTGALDD